MGVEKNCNCNDICVLRVVRGQRNELCCKTAYRNCECKCADMTSSKGRLCLGLFESGQLKKRIICNLFPFPNKV